MGTKASEPLQRPSLAVILGWSGALVALGLLMVALAALPFQLYAVRTGSMTPTFSPRSMVAVHRGEYHLGQPITFTRRGEVITHRFVSVRPDGWLVTKGDANKTPDPFVIQRSDVIGGVVWSVPVLGYWLVYLKSMTGLGSVIFAVIGICLLWSIAHEFDDEPDDPVKSPPVAPSRHEGEQALANR